MPSGDGEVTPGVSEAKFRLWPFVLDTTRFDMATAPNASTKMTTAITTPVMNSPFRAVSNAPACANLDPRHSRSSSVVDGMGRGSPSRGLRSYRTSAQPCDLEVFGPMR